MSHQSIFDDDSISPRLFSSSPSITDLCPEALLGKSLEEQVALFSPSTPLKDDVKSSKRRSHPHLSSPISSDNSNHDEKTELQHKISQFVTKQPANFFTLVRNLGDLLLCPCCKQSLNPVYTLLACGHHFCESCFLGRIESGDCPLCLAPFWDHNSGPNVVLQKMIQLYQCFKQYLVKLAYFYQKSVDLHSMGDLGHNNTQYYHYGTTLQHLNDIDKIHPHFQTLQNPQYTANLALSIAEFGYFDENFTALEYDLSEPPESVDIPKKTSGKGKKTQKNDDNSSTLVHQAYQLHQLQHKLANITELLGHMDTFSSGLRQEQHQLMLKKRENDLSQYRLGEYMHYYDIINILQTDSCGNNAKLTELIQSLPIELRTTIMSINQQYINIITQHYKANKDTFWNAMGDKFGLSKTEIENLVLFGENSQKSDKNEQYSTLYDIIQHTQLILLSLNMKATQKTPLITSNLAQDLTIHSSQHDDLYTASLSTISQQDTQRNTQHSQNIKDKNGNFQPRGYQQLSLNLPESYPSFSLFLQSYMLHQINTSNTPSTPLTPSQIFVLSHIFPSFPHHLLQSLSHSTISTLFSQYIKLLTTPQLQPQSQQLHPLRLPRCFYPNNDYLWGNTTPFNFSRVPSMVTTTFALPQRSTLIPSIYDISSTNITLALYLNSTNGLSFEANLSRYARLLNNSLLSKFGIVLESQKYHHYIHSNLPNIASIAFGQQKKGEKYSKNMLFPFELLNHVNQSTIKEHPAHLLLDTESDVIRNIPKVPKHDEIRTDPLQNDHISEKFIPSPPHEKVHFPPLTTVVVDTHSKFREKQNEAFILFSPDLRNPDNYMLYHTNYPLWTMASCVHQCLSLYQQVNTRYYYNQYLQFTTHFLMMGGKFMQNNATIEYFNEKYPLELINQYQREKHRYILLKNQQRSQPVKFPPGPTLLSTSHIFHATCYPYCLQNLYNTPCSCTTHHQKYDDIKTLYNIARKWLLLLIFFTAHEVENPIDQKGPTPPQPAVKKTLSRFGTSISLNPLMGSVSPAIQKFSNTTIDLLDSDGSSESDIDKSQKKLTVDQKSSHMNDILDSNDDNDDIIVAGITRRPNQSNTEPKNVNNNGQKKMMKIMHNISITVSPALTTLLDILLINQEQDVAPNNFNTRNTHYTQLQNILQNVNSHQKSIEPTQNNENSLKSPLFDANLHFYHDYLCGDSLDKAVYISPQFNLSLNIIVLLCSGWISRIYLLHYYTTILYHSQGVQYDGILHFNKLLRKIASILRNSPCLYAFQNNQHTVGITNNTSFVQQGTRGTISLQTPNILSSPALDVYTKNSLTMLAVKALQHQAGLCTAENQQNNKVKKTLNYKHKHDLQYDEILHTIEGDYCLDSEAYWRFKDIAISDQLSNILTPIVLKQVLSLKNDQDIIIPTQNNKVSAIYGHVFPSNQSTLNKYSIDPNSPLKVTTIDEIYNIIPILLELILIPDQIKQQSAYTMQEPLQITNITLKTVQSLVPNEIKEFFNTIGLQWTNLKPFITKQSNTQILNILTTSHSPFPQSSTQSSNKANNIAKFMDISNQFMAQQNAIKNNTFSLFLKIKYNNDVFLHFSPIMLSLTESISHLFVQFIYPLVQRTYTAQLLTTIGIMSIMTNSTLKFDEKVDYIHDSIDLLSDDHTKKYSQITTSDQTSLSFYTDDHNDDLFDPPTTSNTTTNTILTSIPDQPLHDFIILTQSIIEHSRPLHFPVLLQNWLTPMISRTKEVFAYQRTTHFAQNSIIAQLSSYVRYFDDNIKRDGYPNTNYQHMAMCPILQLVHNNNTNTNKDKVSIKNTHPLPIFNLLSPRIVPSVSFYLRTLQTTLCTVFPFHHFQQPLLTDNTSESEFDAQQHTFSDTYIRDNALYQNSKLPQHSPITYTTLLNSPLINEDRYNTSKSYDTLNLFVTYHYVHDTQWLCLSLNQFPYIPSAPRTRVSNRNDNDNENTHQNHDNMHPLDFLQLNHFTLKYHDFTKCMDQPGVFYSPTTQRTEIDDIFDDTINEAVDIHNFTNQSDTLMLMDSTHAALRLPHLPLLFLTNFFTPLLAKTNIVYYYNLMSSIYNQTYTIYMPPRYYYKYLSPYQKSDENTSHFTPILTPPSICYATWGDTYVGLSPAMLYNLESACYQYIYQRAQRSQWAQQQYLTLKYRALHETIVENTKKSTTLTTTEMEKMMVEYFIKYNYTTVDYAEYQYLNGILGTKNNTTDKTELLSPNSTFVDIITMDDQNNTPTKDKSHEFPPLNTPSWSMMQIMQHYCDSILTQNNENTSKDVESFHNSPHFPKRDQNTSQTAHNLSISIKQNMDFYTFLQSISTFEDLSILLPVDKSSSNTPISLPIEGSLFFSSSYHCVSTTFGYTFNTIIALLSPYIISSFSPPQALTPANATTPPQLTSEIIRGSFPSDQQLSTSFNSNFPNIIIPLRYIPPPLPQQLLPLPPAPFFFISYHHHYNILINNTPLHNGQYTMHTLRPEVKPVILPRQSQGVNQLPQPIGPFISPFHSSQYIHSHPLLQRQKLLRAKLAGISDKDAIIEQSVTDLFTTEHFFPPNRVVSRTANRTFSPLRYIVQPYHYILRSCMLCLEPLSTFYNTFLYQNQLAFDEQQHQQQPFETRPSTTIPDVPLSPQTLDNNALDIINNTIIRYSSHENAVLWYVLNRLGARTFFRCATPQPTHHDAMILRNKRPSHISSTASRIKNHEGLNKFLAHAYPHLIGEVSSIRSPSLACIHTSSPPSNNHSPYHQHTTTPLSQAVKHLSHTCGYQAQHERALYIGRGQAPTMSFDYGINPYIVTNWVLPYYHISVTTPTMTNNVPNQNNDYITALAHATSVTSAYAQYGKHTFQIQRCAPDTNGFSQLSQRRRNENVYDSLYLTPLDLALFGSIEAQQCYQQHPSLPFNGTSSTNSATIDQKHSLPIPAYWSYNILHSHYIAFQQQYYLPTEYFDFNLEHFNPQNTTPTRFTPNSIVMDPITKETTDYTIIRTPYAPFNDCVTISRDKTPDNIDHSVMSMSNLAMDQHFEFLVHMSIKKYIRCQKYLRRIELHKTGKAALTRDNNQTQMDWESKCIINHDDDPNNAFYGDYLTEIDYNRYNEYNALIFHNTTKDINNLITKNTVLFAHHNAITSSIHSNNNRLNFVEIDMKCKIFDCMDSYYERVMEINDNIPKVPEENNKISFNFKSLILSKVNDSMNYIAQQYAAHQMTCKPQNNNKPIPTLPIMNDDDILVINHSASENTPASPQINQITLFQSQNKLTASTPQYDLNNYFIPPPNSQHQLITECDIGTQYNNTNSFANIVVLLSLRHLLKAILIHYKNSGNTSLSSVRPPQDLLTSYLSPPSPSNKNWNETLASNLFEYPDHIWLLQIYQFINTLSHFHYFPSHEMIKSNIAKNLSSSHIQVSEAMKYFIRALNAPNTEATYSPDGTLKDNDKTNDPLNSPPTTLLLQTSQHVAIFYSTIQQLLLEMLPRTTIPSFLSHSSLNSIFHTITLKNIVWQYYFSFYSFSAQYRDSIIPLPNRLQNSSPTDIQSLLQKYYDLSQNNNPLGDQVFMHARETTPLQVLQHFINNNSNDGVRYNNNNPYFMRMKNQHKCGALNEDMYTIGSNYNYEQDSLHNNSQVYLPFHAMVIPSNIKQLLTYFHISNHNANSPTNRPGNQAPLQTPSIDFVPLHQYFISYVQSLTSAVTSNLYYFDCISLGRRVDIKSYYWGLAAFRKTPPFKF